MVIETSDLRKVYGATVAVDGLTLSVDQGEVFGFLGPNGAGKTTTVKMLLGLVYPTAGEAHLLGYRPGDPAAMARVGFLPELFRFHPWLTAADFLDLHGRLYGLSAEERRARIPAMLQRVGLADRALSRLGEFSKGMMQRVGLAQALLNAPEIVFLDEPTSGLDPLGRREVRDLIRELQGRGVTVFLNSHFLSEVEVTCNRVGIVKRGRVVRMGTLAELTAGAVEVEVRAAGLTPDFMARLRGWLQAIGRPGLAVVNPPSLRHEDEVATVTCTVHSEDILPEMADFLVQSGVRLYALAPRRLSLEELFLRVMDEDAAEEPLADLPTWEVHQ